MLLERCDSFRAALSLAASLGSPRCLWTRARHPCLQPPRTHPPPYVMNPPPLSAHRSVAVSPRPAPRSRRRAQPSALSFLTALQTSPCTQSPRTWPWPVPLGSRRRRPRVWVPSWRGPRGSHRRRRGLFGEPRRVLPRGVGVGAGGHPQLLSSRADLRVGDRVLRRSVTSISSASSFRRDVATADAPPTAPSAAAPPIAPARSPSSSSSLMASFAAFIPFSSPSSSTNPLSSSSPRAGTLLPEPARRAWRR